jgi:mannose-6-phosphate isomerase-like protein (cupin superfamily)
MIHEDERRTLEDWPEAKIITAKQDCVLGNHYHKIKTEKFIAVEGDIVMITDGRKTVMEKGVMYTVEPLVHHSFVLKSGSVLLGICSHTYNASDDYPTFDENP